MALRAYAAAEWRCEACGCLMALRCATPLSARRPAAGVCGGRVALQGVRRPNGAAGVCGGRMALRGVRLPNGAAVCDATVGAPTVVSADAIMDAMWARGSVQSYDDACELCFLKYRGRSAFV